MQSVVVKRGIGKWDYEEHTKRSVIAAIVVCAGAAIMAGVVSKQPVKETTFPLQAEEPGTEGKQRM